MSKRSVIVYYDSYEKNFGDGFYPVLIFSHGYKQIIIDFRYSNGAWRQDSGDNIHGLDGNGKIILLDILNDNKICCNTILNKTGMEL